MSNASPVSDQARAYTARRYGRPDWAKGTISRSDAAFLYDMVLRVRPRSTIEIGVASGVSTAFLSTLLSDRLGESRLYAFDSLTRLYNDQTKPVGAYLFELFDQLPTNTSLFPGVSSTEVRGTHARPDQFDFVFLDANHEHPAPAMDLLSLIDIVAPGSWIALHDVWLPLADPQFREFGPLYLYESWPGEKCAPDDIDRNVGAIRLFSNVEDSVAALLDCCRLPWQHQPARQAWDGPIDAMKRLRGGLADELRDLIAHPPIAKRTTMRNCELVIRGSNPWSQVCADLTSGPLILHANRADDVVSSIGVHGLDIRTCNGVMLPNIVRSSDTAVTIKLNLSLKSSDGSGQVEQALELIDDRAHFAHLIAPQSFLGAFSLEIAARLEPTADDIKGAWVKFKAIHFV